MIASDAVQSAADAMPSQPIEVHRRVWGGGIPDEPSLEELAPIAAPALVIGFERDMLLPAVLSREVADAIDGARYVEIPEATHIGPFTHTKEIMDVVLPFLADPPSKAPTA